MFALNYKRLRFVSFIAIAFFLLADTPLVVAQRFLALDVYKWTGAKRFRFHENEKLSFSVLDNGKVFTHTLLHIYDSVIVFDNGAEVPLKNIDKIVVNRSTIVSHGLSKFLIDIGAGYMVLDAFNNSVNGETPILKKQVIETGLGCMIAGKIISLLPIRRYRINARRTLKVIDVTP